MSVITPLETSAGSKIEPGASFTVRPGTAAVIVFKGKSTDVLPEGTYTVDRATLPGLAKFVKLDVFGGSGRTLAEAVGYVVSRDPINIAWESGLLLSKNRKHGMTFSSIVGQATFSVTDPPLYVTSMLREASEFAKRKGDNLNALFPTFLKGKATAYSAQFARENLPTVAEKIYEAWIGILVYQLVLKMNIDPAQVQNARTALYTNGGQAAAGWATKRGATLTGFSVDTIGDAIRAPCQSCKSESAPTSYAVFKRTIGLIRFHIQSSTEGNFCLPCAVKVSAINNTILLFVGWWSPFSLVLTPIFFFLNVGNLIGVMSAKRVSAAEGLPSLEATSQA